MKKSKNVKCSGCPETNFVLNFLKINEKNGLPLAAIFDKPFLDLDCGLHNFWGRGIMFTVQIL